MIRDATDPAEVRHLSYEALGSTNAEALALARAGERGPVWITARTQSAGRGRLVIRKSGTEPLIRVMAEGEDEHLVDEIVDTICAAVGRRWSSVVRFIGPSRRRAGARSSLRTPPGTAHRH